MKMKLKTRVITLVATMSLLGGTAFAASGSTGAYFSDTHNGNVTGTIGSILITPDNPANLALSFPNLLPGAPQTVSVNYHNSGSSQEDIYLSFPNLTALSALNNLGNYGHVVVQNALGGPDTTIFSSNNLDDNSTRCGPFGTANQAVGVDMPCYPVPNQILLASAVNPGAYGTFKITFEYASLLSTQAPANTPWNSWPLPGDHGDYKTYADCILANPANTCKNNQFTIVSGDGSGNGLPYQLIATQVGVSPGAVGAKF